MNIVIRNYQNTDLCFMKEMLYEAVYWRGGPNTPTLEEALALPRIQKEFINMGNRAGDAALIACMNGRKSVGAAWYRYWKKEDDIRGYISDDIPILAIAVKEEFRNQGIGSMLISGLIDCARSHSIPLISLCVSKDNYALKLYRAKGFIEHTDLDHSFSMVCDTK